MAKSFDIEVTGDLAGIITLPKQIEFTAAKTLTDLAKRSQKNIIVALKDDFTIRGEWYLPNRKHGIKTRFATRNKLEAVVFTSADWLLEAHGFNQGIKKPDGGGRNLASPDVEHTRHGIQNKVQKGEKARALLNNTRRTKAFKIKTKGGYTLILQRVGISDEGALLQNKRGNYLRGRGKGRPSTLLTKYIFRDSVRVPQNPVIFKWTKITVVLHTSSYFRQNLEKAIKSAKLR